MTSPKPKGPCHLHVVITPELERRLESAVGVYRKGLEGVTRSQVARWVLALGLEQVEKRKNGG